MCVCVCVVGAGGSERVGRVTVNTPNFLAIVKYNLTREMKGDSF